MSSTFGFLYNGVRQELTLPDPGSPDQPSAFLVGLPKAGSTLLNRVMRPICKRVGLEPFSLHNSMRSMGIPSGSFPDTLSELYRPKGYVYMGYRGLAAQDQIPAFASGRTVFLVRDPRDMVVSQYFSEAFSHRPPGTAADDKMAREFEARRAKLQDVAIEDYVRERAPFISNIYGKTHDVLSGIDHRTWRYEDIVFEKQRWIEEMAAYLGLDVPPGLIARIVEKNDIKPSAEAVTEHVRKVTPGDHKEKLTPETIAWLNDSFAPLLERYGYQ